MKLGVHQREKCHLTMDGLFVFLDSDISEDELWELKRKIKKMHRKKTRKTNRGDSSSHASSHLSSKPSSPLSSTCVENEDWVCSFMNSTEGDVDDTDACKSASTSRLKRRRKVCVSNVDVRSKKQRVNGENGIEGDHCDGFVDSSGGFKAKKLEVLRCCDSQQLLVSAAECGSNSDAEIRCHTCSSTLSTVAKSSGLRRKVTACEKKVVNGHRRNTESRSSKAYSCVNGQIRHHTCSSTLSIVGENRGLTRKVTACEKKVVNGHGRNTESRTRKAYSCVNEQSVFGETFAHTTSVSSSTTTHNVSSPDASSCLTRCKSCASYMLMTLSQADQAETSNYVALDCEFVGVGPKNFSALGRCSIVDYCGAILFDRFVKPAEPVTDYRTPWSGLRPRDLRSGVPFIVAQEQIAAVIKDKVVIGHAVHNDFRVLGLHHPPHMIRDTAACKLLREMSELGRKTALKSMTKALLGRTIQTGEHCSVTDARAALDLFRLVRSSWEPVLQAKFNRRQARLSMAMGEPSGDPQLASFLEDHYWPADLFAN